MNQQLKELAEQLDANGWAAELLDHRWHLVWVSDELLAVYGERDAEQVGVGSHVLAARGRALSRGTITQDSAERWLGLNGPFLLHDAEGGAEQFAEMLDPEAAGTLRGCEPRPAPPAWTSTVDFARDEFFGRFTYLTERVHDAAGELLGYLVVYTLDVPASTAALLLRGDRAMHERMAALVRPGQRSAAVLFADLQASGSLSRRLPSSVYFRLVRDIRTALEEAVAERGGIVGKHAGDGVSALFLAEQLDSASGAARAALESARGLPEAVREVAGGLADEGLPIDPDDCRLKIAVHWGPSLYVGQVASQGRLEITALGDEMNEAARIEQCAAGGQVLASKALVERLDEQDVAALGLDPSRVVYRAIADIEGVDEKAKRDAGSVAVADLL
jgi:class 3 adenylate cyclase